MAGCYRPVATFTKTRPEDGPLRVKLRELAAEYPRYGYLQFHGRHGEHHNHKKIDRLYRDEELQVRKRKKKRGRSQTRRPPESPTLLNERWSIDFLSDFLQVGRRVHILNVIDDFSAESVGVEVAISIPGERVTEVLD